MTKFSYRIPFLAAIAVLMGMADSLASAIPPYMRTVPVKRLVRRSSPAAIMRPTLERQYLWEDEWILGAEVTYTYNPDGKPVGVLADEWGWLTSTDIQYDANGQVVYQLVKEGEGDDLVNAGKKTYRYDEKVPTFCVERMGYDWNGSEWVENYFCETNTITRNSAGNVTDVVKALPLGGMMVDAYKAQWTYGADGKADGYAYFMNEGGENVVWSLNDDTEYRDLTWDRTDGQLLGDILEMVEGPNRLLSATAYYEGEKDGYMFVSYPFGDGGGYKQSFTTNNPDEVGIVRMLRRDGESYAFTEVYYFDDETDEIYTEPVYTQEIRYEADDHGNPASETMSEWYGEDVPEVLASITYENEYDDAGNLLSVTVKEFDGEEETPIMRFEYADYVNVAEENAVKKAELIDSLRIVGTTAYAGGLIEVFTTDGRLALQGSNALDLSSLTQGLYIIRCGEASVKFLR